MDEQGFDVSVFGDTIHFKKERNGCFQANISFEWARSHGVIERPYWLTDCLYSQCPEMVFLVQPTPHDFSLTILAGRYREENKNG